VKCVVEPLPLAGLAFALKGEDMINEA
jgi:hypothetical protein